MKRILNLEYLVSIDIVDKKLNWRLNYYKFKKKTFFSSGIKEGFYVFRPDLSNKCYTKEQLEQGEHDDIEYVVENNKVYFRPYVKLTFVNNEIHYNYFKTYQEALIWGKEITEKYIKSPLKVNC